MLPESIRQQLTAWASEALKSIDSTLLLAGFAQVLRFINSPNPGLIIYEFKPLLADLAARGLVAELEELTRQAGIGQHWFFRQLVSRSLLAARVCGCPGCADLAAKLAPMSTAPADPAKAGDSIPSNVDEVPGVPRVFVTVALGRKDTLPN